MVPVKVRERDNELFLLVAESLPRFLSPVPASMIATRFVSVNVIWRLVVLPPNC